MFKPQQNYAGTQGYHVGGASSTTDAYGDLTVAEPPTLPADTGLGTHVDISYKKEIARQLLDALDEDSLWRLAHIIQTRGLMGPSPSPAGDQAAQPQQRAAADGWYYPPSSSGGVAKTISQTTEAPVQLQLHIPAPQRRSVQQQQLPIGAAPSPIGAAPMDRRAFASTSAAMIANVDTAKATAAKNNLVQPPEPVVDTSSTTMILRNLPPGFDQESTQAWLTATGYGETYDFFLWFPAKATSRRVSCCGYAFVNFRTTEVAHSFRDEMHLLRFPPETSPPEEGSAKGGAAPLPLNVSVAKVQGFNENWERFNHLLESDATTRCSPFFASDAMEAVKKDKEAVDLAKSLRTETAMVSADSTKAAMGNPQGSASPPTGQEGTFTTVVIRNLPDVVDNQPAARKWLNSMGFAGQYDYFLYFPAKRVRRLPGQPHEKAILQNYAYAFVNFRDSEMAHCCVTTLQGWRPRLSDLSPEEQAARQANTTEGDPGLNIVASKVQGLQSCADHFSMLEKTGRCMPWMEPSPGAKAAGTRYQ